MRNIFIYLGLSFIIACSSNNKPAEHNNPRVIVTSDINNIGGDPDDKQSMAHLLMYADQVDIEAIIPDLWIGKGIEATNQAIDAYEKDLLNPDFNFAKFNYPNPDSIRNKVAQNNTDAINRIITLAKKEDKRPLYILAWGNMNTVKDALLQAPEIADKIRLLTIATNKMAQNPDSEQNAKVEKYCVDNNWNGAGRDTIFYDSRFKNLWWIENDWAYNGMFEGEQPRKFLDEIKQNGNLGYHIWEVVQEQEWAHYFRAGDTPTLLYLLENIDHNNPAQFTWGGKFVKPFPQEYPNYWIDAAGTKDWDYQDPCNSWEIQDMVYTNRVNSLMEYREDMYNAFRLKMKTLYGK
ncbi:MAG: hypothetical protein CMO01_11300 [Thalassobius sp.]|nr:hypothetical protein [Thalassovita sp.]